MKIYILLLISTLITTSQALAQRVYAPEITAKNKVTYEDETLVYILNPKNIKELRLSEKQVNILLKDNAKEYFYTLTLLNKGKHLVIKTINGETIQEGIIKRTIDSGIIISKPIKERYKLLKFARRIKQKKQPLIIKREIKGLAPKKDDKAKKYQIQQETVINNLKKELSNN